MHLEKTNFSIMLTINTCIGNLAIWDGQTWSCCVVLASICPDTIIARLQLILPYMVASDVTSHNTKTLKATVTLARVNIKLIESCSLFVKGGKIYLNSNNSTCSHECKTDRKVAPFHERKRRDLY